MPPIIVTLAIEKAALDQLDGLRQQYFPPERNYIDAHITMFHALDGFQEQAIIQTVEALGHAPFPITAAGLRFLGYGVAISISSDALLALRAGLAAQWAPMLTAQDRARYQPHVTIQNKVPPAEAKALLAAWKPTFAPYTILATGLSIWHYCDGPWALIKTVPFRPAA